MALLLAVTAVLNVWFPIIRCESQIADYCVAIVVLTLPIVIAGFAFSAKPKWLGITVAVLGIAMGPLLFVGILYSGLSLVSMAIAGKSEHMEQTDELWQGSTRVRAFVTNGGATVDYGITVRQERHIFPGILLVRVLMHAQHTHGGKLETIRPGLVRVIPASPHVAITELKLKPFLTPQ